MGQYRMGNAADHAGSDGARLNVISEDVAGREGLRIELATVLDATVATEFRDVLTEAISSKKPVRFNAAPVEQISTGCIQLLLAGAKFAVEIDNIFIVSDQSDAFKAAFDDLGLNEISDNWAKPT